MSDGKFLEVNDAFIKLYGYSRDEIIGHTSEELHLWHTDRRPEVLARLRERQHLDVELQGRRKSGEVCDLLASIQRVELQGELCMTGTLVDVTQRKQAEAALQAGARRLAVVLDAQREIASANLSYLPSLQFILEYLSRLSGAEGASLEMAEGDEMVYQAATGLAAPYLGLRLKKSGSLSGLCVTSGLFVRSDDSETDPRVDREACRRVGLRSMILLPLRHAEHSFGALKLMSSRVAAFSSETEKTLGLMAEFISATISRKRAEASLRQSEEEFRAMFEVASIGMAQADPRTGRWLRVNRKMCEITGYSETELLELRISDVTHPADRQADWESFQRVVRGEQTDYQLEKRYRRRDGKTAWVNVNIAVVRDAAGEPVRSMATIEDITLRKEAELERMRLATAMAQAAESIVITDLAGNIVYVNPAFEQISGYSRAEVVGKNPRLLKSGSHDAGFYRHLWETLSNGEVWRGRFVNRRKNGQIYEEDATISPVRDAAGKVVNYMGIKLDVTREVELENQFRQSQKLEAIGQLAGGVAHDFNNILAAIMMQSELALLAEGIPAEAADGLREIGACAERAANLTRQLLLFSRRQIMQSRDLDLNEVVTSLTKMLQRIIGEDVRLQLSLSPARLVTRADAGMLDQVLMNLAVNARDAMPGGGLLRVETGEKDLDENLAQLHPEAPRGRYVWLSVSDTGHGIPPEVLPRIFEPFFTTKEPGKGTGLGLATVFGIVKQHRGWVDVQSEPGKGACFRMFIPALTSAASQGPKVASRRQARGGTETILLAEDDRSVRVLTRITLERHGYRVLEADGGAQAVTLWREHQDRIALLLTDLVMPGGMSGQQLARQLQADNARLKVVYTSGYSAEIAGRELELRAGENFVQKPCSPDQLLETIRKCLDG